MKEAYNKGLAYNMGFEAYQNNCGFQDNPFPEISAKWDFWSAGWHDARRKYESK